MTDSRRASEDSFLPDGVARRVGQYELITPLGKGGMAHVFLARKIGSGGFERLVAVKLLHVNLADDDEFVQMFLDEARLAARIHHPNVVPILDLGNEGGQLFMVMDYVEGDTLAAVQRTAITLQRAIPLGVSLRIILDALIGLDAAHELRDPEGEPLNLIHRDVSPQNILVGSDGAARLVDFGIARAERRLSLTSVGVLKGKAPFMAPEQLEGGLVDRRADVFSMGVTLWETLALRRCFPMRSRPELFQESLHAPYRSLLMFTDQIPEALDAICERALAYEPADRFASASAFADAIETEFRAEIATQRQVGQFMAAVASEKIQRERDAARAASTSSPDGTHRTRLPTDPTMRPPDGSGSRSIAPPATRHRQDSIGPLELRAPTPPPSLELQAQAGLRPLAPDRSAMRAPTPAPLSDARSNPANDLSDQPTMVKHVLVGAPVRGRGDDSELPASGDGSGARQRPGQRLATLTGDHRSEGPRKAAGPAARFSTMAGRGLPHTRAPTPANGVGPPRDAATPRIETPQEPPAGRPRVTSKPDLGLGAPEPPTKRPATLAGARRPAVFQHEGEAAAPKAPPPPPPNALRAPTPAGTARAPLGLRAPSLPGVRPPPPQNFEQLERQISSGPSEGDDELELRRPGLTPVRSDKGLDGDASKSASPLRAPTPATGRQRPEPSVTRAPTPAHGRAKGVAPQSTSEALESGEMELDPQRPVPAPFVEPPRGMPLFQRVAIAVVLGALLAFALLHQLLRG